MINPRIIESLNLRYLKGFHFGNSFISDSKIYFWPNGIKGFKSYVMDCDPGGDSLDEKEIGFYLSDKKRPQIKFFLILPEDIVLDEPTFNSYKEIINSQINSNE